MPTKQHDSDADASAATKSWNERGQDTAFRRESPATRSYRRLFGPKASVSRRSRLVSIRAEVLHAHRITARGPNSWMTWRQAPHGVFGFRVGVKTATATTFRSPAATALKMAVRSAPLV